MTEVLIAVDVTGPGTKCYGHRRGGWMGWSGVLTWAVPASQACPVSILVKVTESDPRMDGLRTTEPTFDGVLSGPSNPERNTWDPTVLKTKGQFVL